MIMKFDGTGTDDLQTRELGSAASQTVKSFLEYWENGDAGYILHY